MKTCILQKTAVCIGVVFALSAVAARADEPKKDDTTTTVTHKHVAAKTTHDSKPAEKKAATTVIPTRDGRSAKYVAGGVVGGANGKEHAVLTGSQLPRTYDRRAYSTNSQDSEYILDKNDQRIQQTNSVQDALRSVPGVNVGGMR